MNSAVQCCPALSSAESIRTNRDAPSSRLQSAMTLAQGPAATPKNPAQMRHPRPLGGDPLRRDLASVHSLSGMVLNNAGGPQQSLVKRKPKWLKAKLPGGPEYEKLRSRIADHGLHTVCQEAGCPNMGECWARGVATIMILGDTCTRSCGFCNVKTGKPQPADRDEPRRVAETLALMGLKHVVITSVDRDDMKDGGAGIWAETILRTREACPEMSIEVLIPDFKGDWGALQMVIDAQPHIINHNLETVRRMYPAVRPSAKFDRSLELLRRVKEQGGVAKTGIMVGIGEKDREVLDLLDDVLEATRVDRLSEPIPATKPQSHEATKGSDSEPQTPGPRPQTPDSCDILTIGQYLQPTRNHLPIDRWVHPDTFAMYRQEGLERGFKVVESGPLVRSSYHADVQADVLTGIEGERARTTTETLNSLIYRRA